MQLYEKHNIIRPTYIPLNEFTFAFQQIVDTYGTPNYLEANPAMLTIATFPFLFGMMFGDMGHGSIFAITGLILILANDSLKQNKGLASLLQGRYLLFLMGIMSTYCGFIYNEFFAIPTNIFGTCYNLNKPVRLSSADGTKNVGAKIYRRQPGGQCVYPFGNDPAWSISNNRLVFINSIKMKMSVIFGVLHMSMGVLCKGTNTLYFRHHIDFVTEVVLGLVILWGLFGWMDLLIIAKFFGTPDIDAKCKPIRGSRKVLCD